MKTNKIFLLLIVITSLFSACRKYDEGPAISVRSRKERIANNWKIDKAYSNGNDVTQYYTAYDLEFTKGGDAKLIANFNIGGTVFSFDSKGTWSFEDNDEKLRLDLENNLADKTYNILKLEEKELWLKTVGGEDELHLKPR
ncbi:MAG TPA: hypothetical protein VF691_08900 [Cytophagaceae bacterium]|jgi:hypothetical protein